jgi:hypothetical protein
MNKLTKGLTAALIFAIIGGALAGIITYRQSIGKFINSLAITIDIGIATTPLGANVIFDGQDIGLSPVKANVKPGIHTLEARKQGYYSQAQAIDVGLHKLHEPDPVRTFNLVLERDTRQPEEAIFQTIIKGDSTKFGSEATELQLRKEITDIKSMILANPEESVTVLALKDRVLFLTEEVKTIKAEIQELRSYSLWYLGTVITLIIALITTIVTLMVNRKPV